MAGLEITDITVVKKRVTIRAVKGYNGSRERCTVGTVAERDHDQVIDRSGNRVTWLSYAQPLSHTCLVKKISFLVLSKVYEYLFLPLIKLFYWQK